MADGISSIGSGGGTFYQIGGEILIRETWAARMRRWASSARDNNMLERPRLRGHQAWRAAPNWTATTAYVIGAAVNANSQLWVCTKNGTSGSTAPSAAAYEIGASDADGTTFWLWQPYTAGTYVSNGGSLFEVTTSGLPATSGGGPTKGAGAITDGTATLAYVGPQECPLISHRQTGDAALTKQNLPTLVKGDSRIRWLAGIPIRRIIADVQQTAYATYSSDPSPSSGNIVSNPAAAIQREASWNGFEFAFEGVKCELSFLFDGTSYCRIAVDGQLIEDYAKALIRVTLDFTGLPRKRRVILVEGRMIALNWINTEPTGAFTRPKRGDDNHVVVGIGDSQAYGGAPWTAALPQSANFFRTLAHLMGWPDAYCDALGGTGYIRTDVFRNYPTRALVQLQRIVAYGKTIDAIFIEGSSNDSTSSAVTVVATAAAFYEALRAAGFNQPIFVIGTPPNGDSAFIANEAAVKAAVAAVRAAGDSLIWHIDLSTAAQPVIVGTGNESAPTGDGNADFCLRPDGVHLNNAGAEVVARYVRDEINAILATQP